MRTKDALPVSIATVLLIAGSCSESRNMVGGGSYSVRDSAGVDIVENREPVWGSQPGWSLESSPELVLGPEIAPDRFFYQVGDMVRFGDGRLVVENGGTQELFVFDSTGGFLTAWGGRGEGPGEFSRIRLVERCGVQELAVLEDSRVTFFDSVGSFRGTARLPEAAVGNSWGPRGIGLDCRSVFIPKMVPVYEPTGIGTFCYPVQGLWVSLEAARLDTVGPFRGPEWVADRSGQPQFRLPFSYTANWASDGRAVYYGWGDRPEIRMFSPEGLLLRILRWRPPLDSITKADWAAFDADVQEQREQDPRGASIYLPREDHPRPDLKPYFGPPDASGSAFLISDEGFLWVRQFTRYLARDRETPPPSVGWWVFDPSGRWLGQVRTPEGFEPRAISGGHVLGVFRNSLNIEDVRSYRIQGNED